MNRLNAIIKEINCSGGVVLVDLETESFPLSALLIDANNPEWLRKESRVIALFKETEVSIAKDFSGRLSMRNKLPCTITDINYGKLMSTIALDFNKKLIVSAITTRSVNLLELKPGDKVLALVKANEIALQENSEY